MKRIIISLIFSLTAITTFAQGLSDENIKNVSIDGANIYRLFPTQNMYTFIKLNTRNGQMWQVQWSLESKFRFENILSEISQVDKIDEKNGRFILYPTTNIYNFILLDQIDGRTWQVQWGKQDTRAVMRIY